MKDDVEKLKAELFAEVKRQLGLTDEQVSKGKLVEFHLQGPEHAMQVIAMLSCALAMDLKVWKKAQDLAQSGLDSPESATAMLQKVVAVAESSLKAIPRVMKNAFAPDEGVDDCPCPRCKERRGEDLSPEIPDGAIMN